MGHGYSDSDWAVRHSTSGYTFMYSLATVSWASKKQPTVALSSCEAEIIAASDAGKEAVNLQNLLRELGYANDAPVELGVDNTSARDLARIIQNITIRRSTSSVGTSTSVS